MNFMGIEKELYVHIQDLREKNLIQWLSKYDIEVKSFRANYRLLQHHHNVSNGRQRLWPPLTHIYTHFTCTGNCTHTHKHILCSAIRYLVYLVAGNSKILHGGSTLLVGLPQYTPAVSLLIIAFFFSTREFQASVLMFSSIQSLAFTLDEIFIWLII